MHVSAFRTAKTRLLLAYLALEADIPHRRNELGALLWADLSDTAAKANLRNTLSNLRQLLAAAPHVLTITRHTVELHSEYVRVDVVEFARRPSLATIDLYKGDFLPGFSFRDAPLLEEWRTMHQERLHLLALITLDELVKDAMAGGDLLLAVQLAQQQLSLESWHERAHLQLIKALALQGQREAALKQYERCLQLLADELGISPSFELQEMVRELKRGSGAAPLPPVLPPAKQPVAHNLPRQTTLFIGREREIRQLTRFVLEEEAPIVTIVGAGGMGKTRLALEAAGRWVNIPAAGVQTRFADGLFFVSLTAVDDPAGIPLAIGDALGCYFHDGEDFQTQLLGYLRQRSILLIFDDIEPLLVPAAGAQDGRAFLLALLQAAPGCRLVVTAQQKLNLGGEAILNVTGLPSGSLTMAPFYGDGVHLFRTTARRVSSAFDPRPQDQRTIRRICQLVEGMPLAIILAAAWIDTLDVEKILAEIERDIDFLTSEWQDIPTRQRSLRATFNYSWKLLSAEDRTTLARLSIFRDGFSRQAAQTITGTSLPRLARLVGKSLLIYDGRRNRYHVHEMLRQFSAEKLAGFDAEDGVDAERQIAQAHSAYFLQVIAGREAALKRESQQRVLVDVAGDFTNVRAAWRWAVAQGQITALHDALEGLYFFYYLSGREEDGVAEFERAIAALENSATGDERRFLQARLKNRIGELAQLYRPVATAGLEELEVVFRRRGAETEIALLLNRRAAVALQQKNGPRALQLYRQQRLIHRRTGDHHREAISLTGMARILIASGKVEAGVRAAEEALIISRARGDRLSIGMAMLILAACDLFWRGDVATAAARCRQVEEISQAARTTGQVTTSLVMSKAYLSFIATLEGADDRAEAQRREVRALSRKKNSAFANSLAAGLDSLAAITCGNYTAAIEKASRGLAASTWPGVVEMNQIALAAAACGLGEARQAATVLLPVWSSVLTEQQLPERSLLLYLLPAAVYLLLANDRPAPAVALLAAGRDHPAWPRLWFDRLPLLRETERRLRQALPAEVYRAAGQRGRKQGLAAMAGAILSDLQAVQHRHSPLNHE